MDCPIVLDEIHCQNCYFWRDGKYDYDAIMREHSGEREEVHLPYTIEVVRRALLGERRAAGAQQLRGRVKHPGIPPETQKGSGND